MSTFFLELENRIGICYSMRAAVRPNKKVLIQADTLSLVRFANPPEAENDGKMEYWNIGCLSHRAVYRSGHFACIF
jgi:hypothetical protein